MPVSGQSGRSWVWWQIRLPCLILMLFLGLGFAASPPGVASGATGEGPRLAGHSLAEALHLLASQGLRIVFTSRVVTPDMVVEHEPTATAPRQVVDEILAPHGLQARETEEYVLVVVRAAADEDEISRGVETVLDPVPVAWDEIEVTPSRYSLLVRDPVAPLALSCEEVQALPHLGDDVFRALPLLPGITANDLTAQFHIRGGRRDEVQILLDGQELYQPFHLKDFDNALSIVDASALESVELSTGGFPVEYGDRMSGALDMTTTTPVSQMTTRLGISLMTAQAENAGTFRDGRGTWHALARRGFIDLAVKAFRVEDPQFWDLFGKVGYQLGKRQSVWGHVLVSDDTLEYLEADSGELHDRVTRHDSMYLWMSHQAVVGQTLLVESSISASDVEVRRNGTELEEEQQFEVRDWRAFSVAEVRQRWSLQAAPRQLLSWGFGLRRYEADYRYSSFWNHESPLAILRPRPPQGRFEFQDSFTGTHGNGYLSYRLRPYESLTVELGARYDRFTLTDESHVSPRLNLVQALGATTLVRAAWGLFYQSQRPYELQVEDGETSFYEAERAEHRSLGFEHIFGSSSRRPRLALRVEGYWRNVSNPRPRYENLYEPYNVFPELEPDRFRIAPGRSRFRGVEIFLRGTAGRGVGWWVNYAYASAEDQLSGRWVPRGIDQPNTLNLNLDVPGGRHWRVNMAWRYHTGWPTTPLTLVEEEGSDGDSRFVPATGHLNSERLPAYHRLDLRASRSIPVKRGELRFFVDIQNVYNRKNASGFDVRIDEELEQMQVLQESWPGFVPSAGFFWEL